MLKVTTTIAATTLLASSALFAETQTRCLQVGRLAQRLTSRRQEPRSSKPCRGGGTRNGTGVAVKLSLRCARETYWVKPLVLLSLVLLVKHKAPIAWDRTPIL